MKNNDDLIARERAELGRRATVQQQKAADPAHSVWVNASAGTGKTKVLSDRVLRLLLSGVSAAKLLCLTYTKAAAVEMNTRVSQKLSRWAVADDGSLENELAKLLRHAAAGFEAAQRTESPGKTSVCGFA